MPIGLYSQSIKNIHDIPDHAVIAIPNDPTNEGRALILLEQIGLIKLKNQVNLTILDIIDNPKKLQIKELEAPTLVMTLPDVTAAVINTDWVVLAGMDSKTVLASESIDSPYANIIVVRKGYENNEDVKKLVAIYQSQEIKDFILKTFDGAVVPAW
jgi:D-methionine transport system substrate-binding protein